MDDTRAVRRRTALGAIAAVGMAAVAGCDREGAGPTSWRGGAGPASEPATGSAAARPGQSGSASPPSATSAGSGARLPAEGVNGPRDKPRVALTFHGQGDPEMVKRLLAELESAQARVNLLAGCQLLHAVAA